MLDGILYQSGTHSTPFPYMGLQWNFNTAVWPMMTAGWSWWHMKNKPFTANDYSLFEKWLCHWENMLSHAGHTLMGIKNNKCLFHWIAKVFVISWHICDILCIRNTISSYIIDTYLNIVIPRLFFWPYCQQSSKEVLNLYYWFCYFYPFLEKSS